MSFSSALYCHRSCYPVRTVSPLMKYLPVPGILQGRTKHKYWSVRVASHAMIAQDTSWRLRSDPRFCKLGDRFQSGCAPTCILDFIYFQENRILQMLALRIPLHSSNHGRTRHFIPGRSEGPRRARRWKYERTSASLRCCSGSLGFNFHDAWIFLNPLFGVWLGYLPLGQGGPHEPSRSPLDDMYSASCIQSGSLLEWYEGLDGWRSHSNFLICVLRSHWTSWRLMFWGWWSSR